MSRKTGIVADVWFEAPIREAVRNGSTWTCLSGIWPVLAHVCGTVVPGPDKRRTGVRKVTNGKLPEVFVL